MSKDKPNKPPLSDDDAKLWKRVAETTEPLKKPANRFVKKPETDTPGDSERPAEATNPGEQKSKTKTGVSRVPAPPADTSPPPLGSYDRGEARAIASGRRDVDARIDLHGMRQREAHRALSSFLISSRARGDRHVLVITGKGSGVRPGERGVLNREVPRWLNEPEFRQIVVGFTPAHKRHGGEGALYVRLRRDKH